MKDKIIKILKKLSFITVQPESDWFKIFVMLLLLAIISLCWNVYFFFAVRSDIGSAKNNQVSGPTKIGAGDEEQMKAVIQQYDAKAAANADIIQNAPAEVADPS